MSISGTKPTWFFDDNWGVSTDAYNWILQHRTAGAKIWKPKGYYANPEMLLKSLALKLARTEPANPDLVKHLETISDRVQAAAARLNAEAEQFIWRDIRRPAAHRGTDHG